MAINISEKNTFLGSQIFQHAYLKLKTYAKCLKMISAYTFYVTGLCLPSCFASQDTIKYHTSNMNLLAFGKSLIHVKNLPHFFRNYCQPLL